MVREFHSLVGQAVNDKPTVPDLRQCKLRIELIREELCELIVAMGGKVTQNLEYQLDNTDNVNLVEVADAVADIEYVTHGTAVTFGLPSEEIFLEVQRSNMTRIPGGTFREDGKFMKGPHFERPNIAKILEEQA